MKRLYSTYRNGNYFVYIFSDGTKVRILPEYETEFKPAFPENIDLKISNKCSMGCKYCHENSTANGEISELLYAKNRNKYLSFKKTLKPFTEVAIGGGALSEIPNSLFWNLVDGFFHTRCFF